MTNPDDRSSGGTADYNQPADQAERLAEVLRDRKLLKETTAPIRKGPPTPRADRGWISGAPETSSYFQEAGLDEDEVGGRYAPRRGNDPVAYPAQPPNSPWACDPCPIEPPLGERVDSLPDMLTLDGFNARGLPEWVYGVAPTEQHSSYDLDPNTNTEGILTSVSTAQTARRAIGPDSFYQAQENAPAFWLFVSAIAASLMFAVVSGTLRVVLTLGRIENFEDYRAELLRRWPDIELPDPE
jgi:hypothetical protein